MFNNNLPVTSALNISRPQGLSRHAPIQLLEQRYEVDIMVPILQMRSLRFQEIDMRTTCTSRLSNPGLLTPILELFPYFH